MTRRPHLWVDVDRLCPRCKEPIPKYVRVCRSCGLVVKNVQGKVYAVPRQEALVKARKARHAAQLRLRGPNVYDASHMSDNPNRFKYPKRRLE
jgi:hypothetical protein